jgi:hypothetical protein
MNELIWYPEQPQNNKMQLTRSGHSRWRPSQLILVFDRPRGDRGGRHV